MLPSILLLTIPRRASAPHARDVPAVELSAVRDGLVLLGGRGRGRQAFAASVCWTVLGCDAAYAELLGIVEVCEAGEGGEIGVG
jgi:hypothetical protein